MTPEKNPNLQICVSDFRDHFIFKIRLILGAVSKTKYFNHFSNFNALYIYIYLFILEKVICTNKLSEKKIHIRINRFHSNMSKLALKLKDV